MAAKFNPRFATSFSVSGCKIWCPQTASTAAAGHLIDLGFVCFLERYCFVCCILLGQIILVAMVATTKSQSTKNNLRGDIYYWPYFERINGPTAQMWIRHHNVCRLFWQFLKPSQKTWTFTVHVLVPVLWGAFSGVLSGAKKVDWIGALICPQRLVKWSGNPPSRQMLSHYQLSLISYHFTHYILPTLNHWRPFQ